MERGVTLLARPLPVIAEHGTRQTASDDIQPTVGCYVRRHTNVAAADRGTCKCHRQQQSLFRDDHQRSTCRQVEFTNLLTQTQSNSSVNTSGLRDCTSMRWGYLFVLCFARDIDATIQCLGWSNRKCNATAQLLWALQPQDSRVLSTVTNVTNITGQNFYPWSANF